MATTATAYYPYDAGAGANITEDQWRKMTGNIIQTGVVTGYLNGLAVTGDSSGMQVKLATGGAWIYGAYGENTSGVQTLAIAASHATLNRYDLIVARNDYTDNVIEFDVIQGTNGASPTVPTVTIDTTKYEIALATVYIAATVTTIAAADVVDHRLFIPQLTNSKTAIVLTSQTTTSASYTRLGTTTDEVRVNVGPSGMALVTMKARTANNGVNYNYIAPSLSGANTLTAANADTAGYFAQEVQASGSNFGMIQLTYLHTGLTPGMTTFSMNYKTSASTASFAERIISVVTI